MSRHAAAQSDQPDLAIYRFSLRWEKAPGNNNPIETSLFFLDNFKEGRKGKEYFVHTSTMHLHNLHFVGPGHQAPAMRAPEPPRGSGVRGRRARGHRKAGV